MLTPAEKRLVQRLAKIAGLPADYLVEGMVKDGCVRGGRLVRVRLIAFGGDALDVSALDALETIDITGALQRLTLGKLPHLISLDLSDTLLESLDLSGCPALATSKLSRSALTSLPALPDGLSTLECDSLPLRTFAPRLPKLTTLVVSRCELTTLELAGAPHLTAR